MKIKVLVIGLGEQGKKYLSYFQKNNYEVFGACQSLETQKNIKAQYDIPVSLNFRQSIKDNHFDIIIISLPPEVQGNLGYEVAQNSVKSKVIIEIPVCWNIDTLKKLQELDNVFFYAEEYYTLLSQFFMKIQKTDELAGNFHICMKTKEEDYINLQARTVSFIHVLNNFLSTAELNLCKLFFTIDYHESEDIFYNIEYKYKGVNIKYVFDLEKKLIIGEKEYIDSYSFDTTLEQIIHAGFDNRSIKISYIKNYTFIQEQLLGNKQKTL